MVHIRSESPPPTADTIRTAALAEQLEESFLAIEVIPVTGREEVYPETVEDIDHRLAPGEEGFGSALDRVPRVDEQARRVRFADLTNPGGQVGETTLEATGSVGSEVGSWHQVAVKVTQVDQGELSHRSLRCSPAPPRSASTGERGRTLRWSFVG